MSFDQPATENFKAADYLGHLVLFENVGSIETIATVQSPETEIIRADVTVLTHPAGPQEFRQTAVFGKALIGTLSRAAVGAQTLGRIGQGPAKPGQSAPWILEKFNDQDAAFAQAYVDQRAALRAQATFSAPVAAPAAPVQAPLPQAYPQAAPTQAPLPQAYPQPAPTQVPLPQPAPQAAPVGYPAAPATPPFPGQAPAQPPAAPQAVDVSQMTAEQWNALPPHVQQALTAGAAAPAAGFPY